MLTFFTPEPVSVTLTEMVTVSPALGDVGLIVGVLIVGGVVSDIGALRFVQTITPQPFAERLVLVGSPLG